MQKKHFFIIVLCLIATLLQAVLTGLTVRRSG